MLVSNNLSWFIYKYDELAELAAVIDRLYEFHQLTEQRPTNKPKNCQHAVQVADASIRTPDNKIILENLNFHVSPGKWLLLKELLWCGKKPHCLKHYPTAGSGLKVIFLLLLTVGMCHKHR